MTSRHARRLPTLSADGYERVRTALMNAIGVAASRILLAEEVAATKQGIDPLYVNRLLVRGVQWPTLTPRHRDVLRAAQTIVLWMGAVPSTWEGALIPEDSEGSDAALRSIASLVDKHVVPKIAEAVTKAIWEEYLDAVDSMDEVPSALSLLLFEDFKRMLSADRFQGHLAARLVVDLME